LSFFDTAQDQFFDIECDLLNLEKLHVRDIYNFTKWDWLRVKGIKKDIKF